MSTIGSRTGSPATSRWTVSSDSVPPSAQEERVAARAAHVEAERGRLGDDPRRDGAAGRAGEQHRGRVLGGLLQRRHPAGGEHHVRLGQARLLGGGAQPAQVAAGRRAERGVDRRRRRALELAHLGGDLVRGDHERLGQLRPQDLRHARLVLRVAEGEQQADRHGFDACAREAPGRPLHARLVELANHALRAHPLVDLDAQAPLDHRRRRRLVQAIEVRARLAAEEQQVAEALGGDERRPGQPRARAARWWPPWSRARSGSRRPARRRRARSTSRAAATTPSSWRAVLSTLAVTIRSAETSTASVNVPPTSMPSALISLAPPPHRAAPRSWSRGPRDRPAWCWPARGPARMSSAAGCARGTRR